LAVYGQSWLDFVLYVYIYYETIISNNINTNILVIIINKIYKKYLRPKVLPKVFSEKCKNIQIFFMGIYGHLWAFMGIYGHFH